MPKHSFFIATLFPKSCKLTLLFLLCPLFFLGQGLTGLWTGALHNDSSTVRKDQLFEIALTEYKGKVYGYSRSEFIVNDTLYYIVKRVKGTIEGDVCEVTDDDIVSYSFRGKLDKGIKVTSTFRRNQTDSTWYLDGTWKTNATKKYYSVTGKVNLAVEKDLTASKLFPHLEELNLANEIAFYKERTESIPVVKVAKPERINTDYTVKPEIVTTSTTPLIVSASPAAATIITEEPVLQLPAIQKTATDITKTVVKDIPANKELVTPSSTSASIVANKKVPPVIKPAETISADERTVPVVATSVTETKKPATVIAAPKTKPVASNTSVAQNKQPKSGNTNKPSPAIENRSTTAAKPAAEVVAATPKTEPGKLILPVTTSVQEIKKPVPDVTEKAAVIAGRKSEFSQVVNFKSDSLLISLYDNGEIDGDTVSVFMNGEALLTKQGLKSSAIKKTIYITPGQSEDFTLVMFAESLGKYPPNTGLLVIKDGEDVYNLRFSSDFQKSTGIVFRKKR